MDKFETIRFEIDARNIAVVTLARQQQKNAINDTMITELISVAELISGDPTVRACILQSEGETFCAGGDLTFMRSQMGLDREEIIKGANDITRMLSGLDDLPCPLIARVQGSVFGGGIGLLSVCDVIIAVDTAEFALRETMLGLIPATIGPFVVRRIGEAWARQYFFSAKTFDAKTAQKMNLVSCVTCASEIDDQIETEMDQILRCQPKAVSIAKIYAKKLAREPLAYSGTGTAELFADMIGSEEAREAIGHFLRR